MFSSSCYVSLLALHRSPIWASAGTWELRIESSCCGLREGGLGGLWEPTETFGIKADTIWCCSQSSFVFLASSHLQLNPSRTMTRWGEVEATQKEKLEASCTAVAVTGQTLGHCSSIIYRKSWNWSENKVFLKVSILLPEVSLHCSCIKIICSALFWANAWAKTLFCKLGGSVCLLILCLPFPPVYSGSG